MDEEGFPSFEIMIDE